MFIDIHAHAFRIKPYSMGFTVEKLIEQYDKMKIDMGCVLPMVNAEVYFTQAVEDIVEMSEKYPDRIIPYCNVDPRIGGNTSTTNLAKYLQYYKDLGCKGVGEVMPAMEVLDPKVQNLFAAAEQVGLPIVYDGSVSKGNGFGLYDDPGLPQLEYTLWQFPNAKIFGHGPVFWSEIAKLETVAERGVYWTYRGGQVERLPNGPITEEGTVPKLFRKCPNLYGDLSDGTAYNAIARDDHYGPRFLTEFQDRLYFGTDMFAGPPARRLDLLLISWKETGKISETVFRKIAYDNAAKLFGL